MELVSSEGEESDGGGVDIEQILSLSNKVLATYKETMKKKRAARRERGFGK